MTISIDRNLIIGLVVGLAVGIGGTLLITGSGKLRQFLVEPGRDG